VGRANIFSMVIQWDPRFCLAAVLCLALAQGCAELSPSKSVRWPGPEASQASEDHFYAYYRIAGSEAKGYSIAGRPCKEADLPAYFSAMGYPSGTEAAHWSVRELLISAAALAGFTYVSQAYIKPQSQSFATVGTVGGALIAATWAWHARPRPLPDIVPEFNTYLRNRSGADADAMEAP
jgi:hypothetical protein